MFIVAGMLTGIGCVQLWTKAFAAVEDEAKTPEDGAFNMGKGGQHFLYLLLILLILFTLIKQ